MIRNEWPVRSRGYRLTLQHLPDHIVVVATVDEGVYLAAVIALE
jgi:hypothetical protein